MMNFIKKSLGLLNAAEGFIHIFIACIGFWGIFATGIYDWRIISAPAINLVLGVFSIFTGYILLYDKVGILKKILAILNTLEGIIHIVVALIGYWGIFAYMVFDWRIWATPTEHLFFGLFSILTGYILGKNHHHHHHH
ncbi:gp48 [Bacillus phage G]|uniref:Gp48 n=1 Tax=Bacillus phage G TaxID=2884420 RepID=G3MBB8_9CAUD|nr:gp48 [Bacillus phage G]AEO93319.1 gp48 [Bacillus phage G]